MTFVTLTDHDTTEGALELAHHPDFIVGEEVTARFPEDGWPIDVVVLGLDECRHREIVARRDDAYALVGYLRAQRLVHFLAHPIYDPRTRSSPVTSRGSARSSRSGRHGTALGSRRRTGWRRG